MSRAAAIVLVAILLIATACATSVAQSNTPGVTINGGTVQEIRLQDGTRCAVADVSQGYSGIGVSISCDWTSR